MPNCVLRAGGEYFDVVQYLADSSIRACRVFRPGEGKRNGPNWAGFNADVSKFDVEDIPAQVRDALMFLEKHHGDLIKLRTLPNAPTMEFDFAASIDYDIPFPSFHWPVDLLVKMGQLGIELSVTVYPGDRPAPDSEVEPEGGG